MTRRMAACAYAAATLLGVTACGSSTSASGGASDTHAATTGATAPSGVGKAASDAAPAPSSVTGLAYATVPVSVPAGNGGGSFSSPRALRMPRGWHVEVWTRIADARFMTWTPQHTLLVSVPNPGSAHTGKVVELEPRADAAAPPRQRVLLSGLEEPEGLGFDTLDGQTVLYVAESDQIDRYAWRGGAGVGARTLIARDLPDADPRGDDDHRLKNLAVGPEHRVYVNIGSAFNASTLDVAGNPPRASVVSFAPGGGDMRVLATGVRNGEGLSFAPEGTLWSAVNERDETPYPFHGPYGGLSEAFGHVVREYVNEHPPDEVVKLTPGRNVGWPYCNPDPSKGYADLPFDPDAQNNPDGKDFDCSKLIPLDRGLPAHSAPLGFHFLQGAKLPDGLAGGAILAVHGSWDRVPPRQPAVLWLPWSSRARTLGEPVTLISGFQEASGARWGRPVDVAPGPEGDLYVSDDTAGAVYRIVP